MGGDVLYQPVRQDRRPRSLLPRDLVEEPETGWRGAPRWAPPEAVLWLGQEHPGEALTAGSFPPKGSRSRPAPGCWGRVLAPREPWSGRREFLCNVGLFRLTDEDTQAQGEGRHRARSVSDGAEPGLHCPRLPTRSWHLLGLAAPLDTGLGAWGQQPVALSGGKLPSAGGPLAPLTPGGGRTPSLRRKRRLRDFGVGKDFSTRTRKARPQRTAL